MPVVLGGSRLEIQRRWGDLPHEMVQRGMTTGQVRAEPGMIPDDEISCVLVVAAHPDDVDFSAGGTVATWTDAGIEVSYCLVTNGDAGGFDPSVPRSQIPAIRRAEQAAAAAVLGVRDLHWLGYPDGALEVSLNLRRDIARVIRRVRPQRVLVQSPERNWERVAASHPDHLAAGEAAMQAIYPDARNPFAHPALLQDEGLEAWVVPEVWVMASAQANHWVDIGDTFERKLAALRAHESQTGHLDELSTFIGDWGRMQALAGGLPEGRLAEGFRVISTA